MMLSFNINYVYYQLQIPTEQIILMLSLFFGAQSEQEGFTFQ